MTSRRVYTSCVGVIKAALLAEGVGLAHSLSQTDQKSVIFIKQPGVSRQISHKEGLIGGIAVIAGSQAQAVNDTAGVGVNNEGRLVGSIEYYRVGCFLADAVDGKELLA